MYYLRVAIAEQHGKGSASSLTDGMSFLHKPLVYAVENLEYPYMCSVCDG